MTIAIRPATPDDLGAVAELAGDAQRDPERFCAYFAEDPSPAAMEIGDVVGPSGGAWHDATWLALDDRRRLVAWLLADTDPDMGRVWWWGPVVAGPGRLEDPLRDPLIDRLFTTMLGRLEAYREHELAIDSRSSMLAAFATRHGFARGEASALLRTGPLADSAWTGDTDVRPLADGDRDAVAALHDQLFAGTHTSGDKLAAPGDPFRLVLHHNGAVVGYVATELHADGSLYVDFVGVAPTQRNQGFGRRLITEAVRRGAEAGASHAHLTVRADNGAARALYSALGFSEERLMVPYRRGFSVG